MIAADSRPTEHDAWTQDYGGDPKGYFIYDQTGHVAIQFCSGSPPPEYASGDDFNPTPAEARAAILNYVAYFGTYTVDMRRHIVTHHVEGSLIPSYMKAAQERPFILTADRLELGDGKTWRRVLERMN